MKAISSAIQESQVLVSGLYKKVVSPEDVDMPEPVVERLNEPKDKEMSLHSSKASVKAHSARSRSK